jgi:hypothetical protein
VSIDERAFRRREPQMVLLDHAAEIYAQHPDCFGSVSDGDPAMSRSKILAEVEAMVFARLFDSGPWLADRESAVALQRKLQQMGLEEPVPGTSNTTRFTPLGTELRVDLIMVFMGLWDEREIPMILEDHGFIDDLEAGYLYDLLEAGRDPEIALKKYVREAYFKYYKTTKLLN